MKWWNASLEEAQAGIKIAGITIRKQPTQLKTKNKKQGKDLEKEDI